MMVHPKEDVDVALFGPQNDPAISIVNTDRPQVPVAGLLDPLVIDAGARRIFSELLNEARHLGLLGLGNAAKAEKKSAEIATVKTFWSIARFYSKSFSGSVNSAAINARQP